MITGSLFTTTYLCKTYPSQFIQLTTIHTFLRSHLRWLMKATTSINRSPTYWLRLFLVSLENYVFPILLKVCGYQAGGLQPLSYSMTSQWVDWSMQSGHKSQVGAGQEGLDLEEFYLINLSAKVITSHVSDSYPCRSCFLYQTVK